MIALAFTLSGLALLTLQVLAADTLALIRAVSASYAASFGHDTQIYPDHTP